MAPAKRRAPSSIDPRVSAARARLANLTLQRADSDVLAAARADLARAKNDVVIDGLVAQAPALTAEQRARLAPLLDAVGPDLPDLERQLDRAR